MKRGEPDKMCPRVKRLFLHLAQEKIKITFLRNILEDLCIQITFGTSPNINAGWGKRIFSSFLKKKKMFSLYYYNTFSNRQYVNGNVLN